MGVPLKLPLPSLPLSRAESESDLTTLNVSREPSRLRNEVRPDEDEEDGVKQVKRQLQRELRLTVSTLKKARGHMEAVVAKAEDGDEDEEGDQNENLQTVIDPVDLAEANMRLLRALQDCVTRLDKIERKFGSMARVKAPDQVVDDASTDDSESDGEVFVVGKREWEREKREAMEAECGEKDNGHRDTKDEQRPLVEEPATVDSLRENGMCGKLRGMVSFRLPSQLE